MIGHYFNPFLTSYDTDMDDKDILPANQRLCASAATCCSFERVNVAGMILKFIFDCIDCHYHRG